MSRFLLIIAIVAMSFSTAYAEVRIDVKSTQKPFESFGVITAKNTRYGLLLTPQLKGLPPGAHGFHIHVNPSCDDHGQAAGGHYDPYKTGKHLGPYNNKGHLGDLPALMVNASGEANIPVLAPRLTERLLKGRALMLHAGGDNYSDTPQKLGGGGVRIACGVILKK
jgi:superoxide dismutase, Cu-Zn family